jgi:hypothetical protein
VRLPPSPVPADREPIRAQIEVEGAKIEERQLEAAEIGQFALEIGQLIHSRTEQQFEKIGGSCADRATIEAPF